VLAQPLDREGQPIPEGASPEPRDSPGSEEENHWAPFKDRLAFEAAIFLYRRSGLPQVQVDALMKLWAASMFQTGGEPPYSSNEDLLRTIDAIDKGVVPWEEAEVSFPCPPGSPTYMRDKYKIYFRDPHQLLLGMLANGEFDGKMDYAAYQHIDANGKRQFRNLMGANHAWRRSVSVP
jgi:hypothetical protein